MYMVQNILMYILSPRHSKNITNYPLVKQELYQLQTSVLDIFQPSSGLRTTDMQIRPE